MPEFKHFWISLQREMIEVAMVPARTAKLQSDHITCLLIQFLQAGSPSYCPTNGVKALKADALL